MQVPFRSQNEVAVRTTLISDVLVSLLGYKQVESGGGTPFDTPEVLH